MKRNTKNHHKNQYNLTKTIHSPNNTILTTPQINQITRKITAINNNVIITPNQTQQAKDFTQTTSGFAKRL